jgi:zinc transporter ZupT
MLYVIADELTPDSHNGGNERAVTVALLAGVLMMMLDIAFG